MSPTMEIPQLFQTTSSRVWKGFPYIKSLHVQPVAVVSENAPGRCEGQVLLPVSPLACSQVGELSFPLISQLICKQLKFLQYLYQVVENNGFMIKTFGLQHFKTKRIIQIFHHLYCCSEYGAIAFLQCGIQSDKKGNFPGVKGQQAKAKPKFM